MVFQGWQKTSLIEFPGRIATVLFVSGCNLRCPWCYNPQLALGRAGEGAIGEAQVLAYLDGNRKLHEAVVVTGGEPCLSCGLESFLRKVRERGLLTGLETNGTHPQTLARLLEQRLLDHVALDVKAPADAELYSRATGVPSADLVERVSASLRLLACAAVDGELRTTVVPGLHGREELMAIAAWLRSAGWPGGDRGAGRPARRWVLQPFVGGRTLAPAVSTEPSCSRELLERLARGLGEGVEVRA